MIKHIAARRAARLAERRYRIARLDSLIAENDARLAEIERQRNAPCLQCEKMGASA